ncbi:hypothetical protein GCM10025880_56870 [Methylorubrum aminovorans]|uniref:phage adaptor protein n=1 Tax=Methylorubrum aminovorans TaxID=269069 RepID=UPI0023E9A1E0|nr:hypothetical protein [Methylorubrum aminovorans]GMA79270.1 hypothetical protein GCM10025880_56870 [Methylorubrum aminovorans]
MPTTLADIRNRVLRKLARHNMPVSLVNQWIGDAVRRIQQTIRVPIDEALTQVVTDEGFNGLIDIPTEMTELLSLRVNGIELEQRSITEINAQRALPWHSPAITRAWSVSTASRRSPRRVR